MVVELVVVVVIVVGWVVELVMVGLFSVGHFVAGHFDLMLLLLFVAVVVLFVDLALETVGLVVFAAET